MPSAAPSVASRAEPVALATGPGEGPEEVAVERTVAMPAVSSDEVWPLREVSIDELIDVDQQADFFAALGQDTAAADLLVAHLRDTGGGSPMTYLKLLEVYARQGDRDAFERLAQRFEQRFHTEAPAWGSDPGHGRSLDDYVDEMGPLQQAWVRPMRAMMALEELLRRRAQRDPLDLPAYRDALFLYSLARDRLEQDVEPSAMPAVPDGIDLDLSLPGEASRSEAMPLEARPEVLDYAPTTMIDLDLTLPSDEGRAAGAPLRALPDVKPPRQP